MQHKSLFSSDILRKAFKHWVRNHDQIYFDSFVKALADSWSDEDSGAWRMESKGKILKPKVHEKKGENVAKQAELVNTKHNANDMKIKNAKGSTASINNEKYSSAKRAKVLDSLENENSEEECEE